VYYCWSLEASQSRGSFAPCPRFPPDCWRLMLTFTMGDPTGLLKGWIAIGSSHSLAGPLFAAKEDHLLSTPCGVRWTLSPRPLKTFRPTLSCVTRCCVHCQAKRVVCETLYGQFDYSTSRLTGHRRYLRSRYIRLYEWNPWALAPAGATPEVGALDFIFGQQNFRSKRIRYYPQIMRAAPPLGSSRASTPLS
jgi:hypothetical protein